MKKISAACLLITLLLGSVPAQTPQRAQPPQQEPGAEDVVRITTELVQADVVVTDKDDQIIPDLKLSDFDIYDNGKKQDIKFMEFVSVETPRRTEGQAPSTRIAIERDVPGVSARELKRVFAFVIDDLTIPDADLPSVRDLLLDFVNNKMGDGDLVAIVRTIGGKGLLQQFTSDRQLLRRAIATMNVITHPFKDTANPDPAGFRTIPRPVNAEGGDSDTPDLTETGTQDITSPNDEVNRLFRGLTALTTANFIIDSLKEIPGHKNLVIVSGGIPIFEAGGNSGAAYSNVSYMLNRLSDNAIRAGVAVNTLDPRGLKATPGVVGFEATPAMSGLGAVDPTFGRGGVQNQAVFGELLAGGSEHLGLSTVANATGGLSIVNTNDFKAGLNKIVARSKGYYTLAYRPSEKFDNKFHKIEVKVKRSGVKVLTQSGYLAKEEKPSKGPRTKEEEIAAAARSPLAQRDIDLTPVVTLKLQPNKATVDIHILVDAKKLHFNQTADGQYQTSFDVVGFVFDQLGKLRGGFSETINTRLTPENYRRALNEGLDYSATTELPPGYFQLRAVVRETGTGSLGTFSKYLEIPDLRNGRLAMSSIFLIGVDPANNNQAIALLGLKQLSRKQELRYAVMIHNAKLKDSKPQLRSQLIISQGSNILFREPEQPIEVNNPSQVVKVGQLRLAGVKPGRYALTLIITDPLADKKVGTISRSIDFNVTE
jgi:VWFA-related protein